MANVLNEYENSVHYLYSLQKHGIKLGLANIRDLMLILGEPHTSFRSVHIAGTNGKGSTAAEVASILARNGFRVGLFTSPHLVSFTERISINNQRITEHEVIELASTSPCSKQDSPESHFFRVCHSNGLLLLCTKTDRLGRHRNGHGWKA